jgi:hypothetical protein
MNALRRVQRSEEISHDTRTSRVRGCDAMRLRLRRVSSRDRADDVRAVERDRRASLSAFTASLVVGCRRIVTCVVVVVARWLCAPWPIAASCSWMARNLRQRIAATPNRSRGRRFDDTERKTPLARGSGAQEKERTTATPIASQIRAGVLRASSWRTASLQCTC